VIQDIRERLGREDMRVVDTGTYRENLTLEVIPVASVEDKLRELDGVLTETPGTGIVYTSTVKDCEAVTRHLRSLGHEVARYHGRLGARERHENQDRFMAGELKAIVATNAFGMGIDKADIRFVTHFNLPGSLESYYQEAGRAGRDGEPSRCTLFYLPEDRNTQIHFLNGRYPKREHFAAIHRLLARLGEGVSPSTVVTESKDVARSKAQVALSALADLGVVEEPEPGSLRLVKPKLSAAELDELAEIYQERARNDRERLQSMVRYAQTALCRWRAILDYFGEEPEFERCGHCDRCAHPRPEPRETRPAAPSPSIGQPGRPLPLPPLMDGRTAADLAPGEEVNLPAFGAGTVRESGEGRLLVDFENGETREFLG
jgi:ATP-dependent DNA helicase RecQ